MLTSFPNYSNTETHYSANVPFNQNKGNPKLHHYRFQLNYFPNSSQEK